MARPRPGMQWVYQPGTLPPWEPPQVVTHGNALLGAYMLGLDALYAAEYVITAPFAFVLSFIPPIDYGEFYPQPAANSNLSYSYKKHGQVITAKSTRNPRGTITAPRRPRTFDYLVDFTTLNLFSQNCTNVFPFIPASCNAVIADESNIYVNYTGWDVSIDASWLRNFPCVSICGHFRTNVLTAWIEYDCHFVPSTISDSTEVPHITVSMVGKKGASLTFNASCVLSDDIRDGRTYHVIGPVAYPLIGDVTTDNGIDVEVIMHMEGGHAVAGTGPFLYISNLHLRGTAYGYSVPF